MLCTEKKKNHCLLGEKELECVNFSLGLVGYSFWKGSV
jgi:hypothetical protein